MRAYRVIAGVFVLSGLLAGACDMATPEELASLAAKGYYEHLIQGDYEHFLEGKDGMDSVPNDYREQMLTACRQYLAQQERTHRGIHAVRISNAKTDTAQRYTNVFLVLCFGDSTNEEIVVPMVERTKGWRMK